MSPAPKTRRIIVSPEALAPIRREDRPAVARYMHGHGAPFLTDNPIALHVWRKPTKAERRLYSGAIVRVES